MRKLVIFVFITFLSSYAIAQGNLYFPPVTGANWDTIPIAYLNWCESKVDSFYYFLDSIETKSFVVLKDGKIVLEKYFGNYTVDSTFSWYSAAKSFRAVLIGKAQEENYLNLSDTVSTYLGSGWTSLNLIQEDSISIWNQITMTSGLDETNFLCVNPSCLNYVSTAGSRWAYHNGPYSLSKNVLEAATGMNHNIYSNTIENQIGMNGIWLSFLGNSSYYSNARDMARFGLLINSKGVWGTDTILYDTNYINQMISPSQSLNPSYGYLWWLNGQSYYISSSNSNVISGSISPDAPNDVYTAAGSYGQFISISPSEGLIMVRQGLSSSGNLTEFEMHNELWSRIMNLECTVSNIEEKKLDASFEIYPNPAEEIFTVRQTASQKRNLSICNMVGKIILNTHFEGAETIVDIKDLTPGIYFVRMDNIGVTKLIVN